MADWFIATEGVKLMKDSASFGTNNFPVPFCFVVRTLGALATSAPDTKRTMISLLTTSFLTFFVACPKYVVVQ
ncbi:hypothetical protein CK477_21020 [Enterobacter cloacae]|uniref:hypothetical protein n=1 Tax=Enterobacter quasihormaechei TaxID=2529382 RepID=UPI000C9CAB32|nr:hypothetical protein CK477_21020 [Enterobacter cloacae]